MTGDAHVDERSGPDASGVEALVEAYSRGAGELVKYLRQHETAEFLITTVSQETGVRRLYVRAAYNLLVGLVVNRGEAGARKLSAALVERSVRLLGTLPFYQPIAKGLLRLEERLRREADLKARLEGLLSGQTAAAQFGATTELSREAQLTLHALKEQEELWGELDRGFGQVLGRLNPRPPLTTRTLGPESASKSASRLLFNAQRIPFVGRAVELGELDAFLGSERRFCWWHMTGRGGLGKSRLALELCTRCRVVWRAGFLRKEAAYDGWETWQPEAPTLVVLDYAGSQVERVRRIITALRDRRHELDAPVRLLLLEREAEGHDWWRQLVSPDASGAEIRDSAFRAGSPLVLGGMSDGDLWATITFVLTETARALPDRASTLEHLREIDPDGRPLFAGLAADALAEGRVLRGWDRARLIEDVLNRERARMWPDGVTPAEVNLLALATMCGSLTLAEAEAVAARPELAGLLPDFDPDAPANPFSVDHIKRMAGRGVATHPESGLVLPGLEPNIVGELFVLRHLVGNDGRLARRRAERLRDAAWALPKPRRFAFAEFIHRCAEDFLDEAALEVLAEQPDAARSPDGARMWARAAYGLVMACARVGRVDRASDINRQLVAYAAEHPDDRPVQHMTSATSLECLEGLLAAGRTSEAEAVYRWVTAMSAARHEDTTLGGFAVRAHSRMLVSRVESKRLDDAIAIYEQIAGAALAHTGEPSLRLAATDAAIRLRVALAAADRFDHARRVLERLSALVIAHPDSVENVDLRVTAASEAQTLLGACLAAGRFDVARELFDELRADAARWAVGEIRMQVAHGAVMLFQAHLASRQFDEAAAFVGVLTALAESHPKEADLRLASSGAGGEWMLALAREGRASDAVALWHHLSASALAHPYELFPRIALLQRAAQLVRALGDAAAAEAREIEADVQVLASSQPTVGALRMTEGAMYFERLISLLANEKNVRRLTAGAGLLALPRLTGSAAEPRLEVQLMRFLVQLADFGAAVEGGERLGVRAEAAEEARLRVLVARGAAAAVEALRAEGHDNEARSLTRSAATYLRSPEYLAFASAHGEGDALGALLRFTDESALRVEDAPGNNTKG